MLVEDDDVDARRVHRALSRSDLDFAVTQVALLGEAMLAAETQEYDVILLDLGLPDGTGVSNLSSIQEVAPCVPVVILTGRNDKEIADHSLRNGAQDYLNKNELNDGLVVKSLTYAIQRKKTEIRLREGLDELEKAARIDPLTGLLNRRSLFTMAQQTWKAARDEGETLACVMLDLDFFKRVNDVHGHLAGDEALASIAKTLLELSRAGDLIGRYGGEEFCAILCNISENDALAWAERIRTAVRDSEVATQRATLNLTVSLGVAFGPADCEAMEDLIDRADQALLASKQRGRNIATNYADLDGSPDDDQLHVGSYCVFRDAKLQDYMTAPIRCLSGNDTIASAAAQLLEVGVNSLPVVNPRDELIGILSEKDLIGISPFSQQWVAAVESVMCKTVVSFSQHSTIREVREFLSRVAMRRIVVVDDAQRPVGVISRSNLLRHQLRWAASLAEEDAKPETAST